MRFIKNLIERFFPKPQPKSPPPLTLAGLAYAMAYQVLPSYAFGDHHDLKMWSVTKACGPYFYLLTLGLVYGMKPQDGDTEDGRKFHWHKGQLKDGRTYFLMEYPETPEHKQTLTEEEFMKAAMESKCVLPPYFSAMVGSLNESGEKFTDIRYFVLGKSPIAGATTLREVTAEANINRGIGPEPKLECFLSAIETS